MNKTSILLVLILLLPLFILPFNIDIPEVEATTSYTINLNANSNNVYTWQQRLDFVAKGRWWFFYKDNAGKFVYSTSTDQGKTWNSPTIYANGSGGGGHSGDTQSVVYDSIADKVHVTYEVYGVSVYYRRGTPNTDGTITWDSVQTVVSANYGHLPIINLDTSGYPWIGWGSDHAAGAKIYKSSTKDGTWTIQVGFPKVLTTLSSYHVIPIQLLSNKMYFIFGDTGTKARGIAWTGSAFTAEEVIGDMNEQDSYGLTGSSDNGSRLFIAYLTKTPFEIRFKERRADGTWKAEEQVATGLTVFARPALTTLNYNETFVFWANDANNKLYYNIRAFGIWHTVPSVLVDESVDQWGTSGPFYSVTARASQGNNTIGIFYGTLTSGAGNTKVKVAKFLTAAPENQGTTILDMEGCGDWLFCGERYYSFQTVTGHPISWTQIDTVMFKFFDGVRNVTVAYNVPDNLLTIPTTSQDYLSAVLESKTNTSTTFTFTAKVFLKTTISDYNNVPLYSWSNSTSGDETAWEIVGATTLFNIYNLGAGVEYKSSGAANASFISGGDPFEIWANYNGWIAVNQSWRNLQSYHAQFSIKFQDETGHYAQDLMQDYAHYAYPDLHYTDKGAWKLEIDIYYCDYNGGAWVKGWHGIIEMEQGDKGTIDQWTQLNVTWYDKNQKVKSDLVTAFLEADPQARETLWVNMWFNQANASSAFGGRVNPYYYGMRYIPGPIIPLLGEWQPLNQTQSNSMGSKRLLDSSNNIISSHNLKMMKIGYNLSRPILGSDINFKVILTQFDLNQPNLKISGQMEGIPTPEPDKTILPTISPPGILAPLYAAISSIGSAFIRALISALGPLASAIVSILDYVFGLFGWNRGFSQLLSWMGSFISWIPSVFTWMISLLTSIFLVLTAAIPLFLQSLIWIVSISLSVFTTLLALGNMLYGYWLAIWVYIDPFWSILLELLPYGVEFYVLYLLYLGYTGRGDRAWELLKFTYEFIALLTRVTMILFDIFHKVADITVTILMGLLDVI